MLRNEIVLAIQTIVGDNFDNSIQVCRLYSIHPSTNLLEIF